MADVLKFEAKDKFQYLTFYCNCGCDLFYIDATPQGQIIVVCSSCEGWAEQFEVQDLNLDG